MSNESRPRSSAANGRLWGARAHDWADVQEGMARPAYEAVLERTDVQAGARYLDVGCGAGMAAEIAAKRGAYVSGVDAAEALLVIARERTPGGDFHLGDIENLPFADQTFDVITGFNSFQYAGNPRIALTEARRVAKRDAQVVVMTWGQPEGMPAASLVLALRPLMPPPPRGAPGPFALSDEAALRKFVTDAGLHPVDVFDVDSPFHYADLEIAVRALNSSGVAARAMENSGEQAVSRAHREALAPFRQSDGTYRIGAKFRCLLAHP